MLDFEDQREWVGQSADFGEEHMQFEHGDGKFGCSHGLELFLEGEGSIFVTGLEAKTVTGYSLTLLDEIRFNDFNVSGRDEIERLFGFQVTQGEDLRSVANEGRFEFVLDEALTPPTEGVVVIGEGGR